MRLAEARGAEDVARLLRDLADEIEQMTFKMEGRAIRLADSLEAVVDVAAHVEQDVSRIDIRLEHPAPAVWDVSELRQAMTHPGD